MAQPIPTVDDVLARTHLGGHFHEWGADGGVKTYLVRRIGSKVFQEVQASSPADAAYLLEGTGAPMEIVHPAWPASWRFRRFDEKRHNAFSVTVQLPAQANSPTAFLP